MGDDLQSFSKDVTKHINDHITRIMAYRDDPLNRTTTINSVTDNTCINFTYIRE